MLDPRYAFISAYLKGAEAKLITPDHVKRMINISSIHHVLAIIRGTDIGDYLQEVPIRTFDDVDECLWRYLGERIAHIEAISSLPDDVLKILRAYVVKYDIANIKAALRGILTGMKANMIPLGIIYNNGLLDNLSNAETIDGIIELLISARLGDYISVLKEYKMDQEVKSRLITEAKLDGQYYNNLLDMTKKIKDGSLLAKSFSLIIELTNLQIVSRAIIEDIGPEAAEYTIAGGYILSADSIKALLSLKLTDVPGKLGNALYHDVAQEVLRSYNRTQSITSVEQIIDKYKFSLVKEILSPRVLSPLVIAWHLILKEVEIRNLRMILKAMFDNLPPEEIRQYLVLSS